MQTKPNLFLIGFQKCGSSALYQLLCAHPAIEGTNPKETFYLADEGYENFDFTRNVSNTEAGWDLFLPQGVSSKYTLEASVCNFYQQTALTYIKKQKDARVLIIMRDPVERFISNYKYYSGNIPKIKGEVSIEEYYDQVKAGAYTRDSLKYALAHGHYSGYIDKWQQELGKDKVHLVSFKKMVNDPDTVMKEVCDFLQLEFKPVGELKKVNASKKIRNKKLHSLLIKYFSDDFPLKAVLKKIYYGLFATKSKVEVSASFKSKLMKEYEKEYKLYNNYF